MILRCTAKVLALLDLRPVADVEPGDDDFYANLLWIERRKCLILTHAATMFPVFVPDVRKADVTPFGPWVGDQLQAALADEMLDPGVLGDLDPRDTVVARTASRRTLGFMNDMAKTVEWSIISHGGLASCDVRRLNRSLRRHLHTRDGGYATAMDLVGERDGGVGPFPRRT
ncbi:MAG: hypothetical protein ABI181_04635 [Mycobacteriaceae bacterium]